MGLVIKPQDSRCDSITWYLPHSSILLCTIKWLNSRGFFTFLWVIIYWLKPGIGSKAIWNSSSFPVYARPAIKSFMFVCSLCSWIVKMSAESKQLPVLRFCCTIWIRVNSRLSQLLVTYSPQPCIIYPIIVVKQCAIAVCSFVTWSSPKE